MKEAAFRDWSLTDPPRLLVKDLVEQKPSKKQPTSGGNAT